MAGSKPSLLALLGLVAYAGYQNRDRIGDMLSGAQQAGGGNGRTTEPGAPSRAPSGGFLDEIAQFFQGGTSTAPVSIALKDMLDHFRASGRSEAAESWVSANPNRPIDVDEMAAALGPDTLAELSDRTGMPRQELLLRLSAALPEVVNRLTPEGRLPTEQDGRTAF
ncbi:MAG: YidB family protein [Gemmobacter sp.]|jgi:uncharacterized protein YidB (DUF937 family)|nr:YidB family protein [Gemmobacter sp.]